MKEELVKKWAKALRSGKYKQTSGFLCTNKGYCCLGVLYDIAKEGDWTEMTTKQLRKLEQNSTLEIWEDWDEKDTVWKIDGKVDFPTEKFLSRVSLDPDYAIELAGDNDDGISFDAIADKIEHRFLPDEAV